MCSMPLSINVVNMMMKDNNNIKVCGIDPHKRKCQAVILSIDQDHHTVAAKTELRFDNNLTGALELLKLLRDADCNRVVIENSNNFAYALYEFLREAKVHVELVGPSRVPAKHKKSDRVDAEWLALMYSRSMVSLDYVPTKEIRQLRDLLRLRSLLVRARTMLKNNVHANLTRGTFDISKIVSDAFGKRGFEILEMLSLASVGVHDYDDALLRLPKAVIEKYKDAVNNSFIAQINGVTLGVALGIIKALNEGIKELEDTIAQHILEHEELKRMVELIMTIPGIGLIVATTIVAEVGDFSRFGSKKELAAWAGMIPDTEESNGKQKSHGITKRGSPHIRRVLCEAANVIALHGKPVGLLRFYKRILHRKGRKVAIVALGHKLLRVIYALIVTEKRYEDEEVPKNDRRGRRTIPEVDKGELKRIHTKKLKMLQRRGATGKAVMKKYREIGALRAHISTGMSEEGEAT